MIHVLDANTLIEAKDSFYRMRTFPGFWHWLDRAQAMGQITSIDAVARELARGNDDLAAWARQRQPFFVPESDTNTQHRFAQVAQHVAAQEPAMRAGALQSFLSGADPWIIAWAQAHSGTVVTLEKANPAIRRKYLIPNVCAELNVPCIDMFDLFERLDARFILPSD